MNQKPTIENLIGKTLIEVRVSDDNSEVFFATEDGKKYKLYHEPDCCESVSVEDFCGSVDDLLGSPITQAEESTSDKNPPDVDKERYQEKYQDSFTWTFYRLATAKGQVVIRFYGESNGYYSESVDFAEIKK